MSARFDVLVLGAGIVGVSVALHLQNRGRSVALVDRGAPGQGTSFGNAGFIEASAVLPHPFPRGLGNLLRFALNRSDAVRTDYTHLPRMLAWLLAYKRASGERSLRDIGPAFRSLIGASLPEHRHLMEQSGTLDLLREDGWLELCRSDEELDMANVAADYARAHGIRAMRLDRTALRGLEPGLRANFSGAIHWIDTARITDPGGLVERLAAHFRSRGGRVMTGDALGLRLENGAWYLPATGESIRGDHAVVAMGPWSGDLISQFGYALPLAAKRGYHQHFQQSEDSPLTRPVYVRDRHCLIVPAAQGVRVMTGVELAPRDAPPTPIQLDRMIACARETLTLGPAIDDAPWLGARPCMPDMLPVIGPAPRHSGLWFAFGHGHYGLTQGPATGRLIAEMMTGETPFLPVHAFSPGRFFRSAASRERLTA